MIWYLLYPFRGTVEAPVLAPTHPLRITFTRYGKYVSRHVVSTLLISVAVASMLVYPFAFLYSTDFTNGASNIPHHVWTDAQPLPENSGVEPDVVMRHVWVHGNYMQALDRDVLLGALELQDALLGPTVNFNPRKATAAKGILDANALELSPQQRDGFHIVHGLTNESWFFHSALQYWSCDANRIAADKDIVATVNEKKMQATSANTTLRLPIVFSGKRFEDRRLVAADAVVITLIHRRNSPVGRIWQEKAKSLASRMSAKWDVYPSDGASMASHLYEFQFRPMSYQDALVLSIAYLLTVIYFVVSLSKLRAVKSRLGLIVTVLTQVTVSIMSSFTLCAILKIDLSRIPRFAYPIAICSMSLENIFRLINAVILTPPEDSTSNRIGEALGETTHIALASVAQNLLVLWGLSHIVSPGVSAFCSFAAIAIIFDFFYLSTFFLSVLSIDVRRTELSDALAKASLRNNRSAAEVQARQSWFDAMLQGKIALSTRIAGTFVLIGFILMAQWHFFEHESIFSTFSRLFHLSEKSQALSSSSRSSLLIPIHQARSPTSWLRLQDHESAREVIRIVKPNAHSYIARVFDPLVFVLKGADRMPKVRERLMLPAVYDFIRHQSTPFLVVVVVLVAGVRILMNYLLWDELGESAIAEGDEDDPILTVKTLIRGHSLDVAMLSASGDGHIISVGLDRIIRIWDVKGGGISYVLMSDEEVDINFPVLALCTSDDSRWLALLTTDAILLWDLRDRKWGPYLKVDTARHKPEGFFFTNDETQDIPPLVFVRRDGVVIEVRPDKKEAQRHIISEGSPLVSAGAIVGKVKTPTKIMAATREGEVHCLEQDPSGWNKHTVVIPRPIERELLSIVPLPELGYLLVVRNQSIDLVDGDTYEVLHSFRTDPIQPKSLKCFHSSRRQMQCGSVGLKYMTFAYLNAYTRDLVVHSFAPPHDGESICFRMPGLPVSKTCCKWPQCKETRRVIPNPGVWEALPSGMIIGVRKKAGQYTNGNGHQMQPSADSLRHRRVPSHSLTQTPATAKRPSEDWEVWMYSTLGKGEAWETAPFSSSNDEEHLFATKLGPVVRVGRGCLAVGLSNVIKIILVGHERFDSGDDGTAPTVGRRRNRGSGGKSKPHLASQ